MPSICESTGRRGSSLRLGWRVRTASWVVKHAGPSRPVELGLMFETVKSFWLQAVPPASLSWHLESSVFEKTRLWSTPPGGGPWRWPPPGLLPSQPLSSAPATPRAWIPGHITVWPSLPSLLTTHRACPSPPALAPSVPPVWKALLLPFSLVNENLLITRAHSGRPPPPPPSAFRRLLTLRHSPCVAFATAVFISPSPPGM